MPDDEYTATLFMNGGSQAVRLPRAFRFEGSAVRIRREGRAVILEPLEKAEWPAGFWERLHALGPLSEDFDRPEPLPPSPRRDEVLESLDE
ncbi:MAG TPA: hypothetical protein VFS08_07465 [Gemmatimonadaceae bacterium]|nr:hypothetical protein [Gemmatimonadaceae bacterium]